ncbi:hypothetical protein PGUG_00085 [Meyerozyma guilliermondii ATCC 6260]|uniref:Major facilitator superfamily (MFS) profile domain-containing protein n=1 Tax=Meyerozyma guilliermondii (strain ATCC 6260 / CBS 566 / DSM 6381 / JCM 1539 / NBRC 10279 / NRRL Y-324) TaxID=294746 RepID=A5D9Y0_PICGU|nr:uncharacterized protein PGUG_00085 [Meyerozyma guilliermondii ATCC 6260]EDK35987.2 hypothetical protein PGUG_00085 [Meyerozyma guilliermondii ATCC 6260]
MVTFLNWKKIVMSNISNMNTDVSDPETVTGNEDKTNTIEIIEPQISLFHEILFVLIIFSGQFVTQVSVAQGLSSIRIIGEWFNITNEAELTWSIASLSLSAGTLIIIAGRLGDILGHKRMFLFGYVWLTIWSLLTGASSYSNAVFYYCCKGFQGVGPAFLLPNGLAILGRFYPPGKRKTIAFVVFGAGTPLGFVFGSIFGAIFSQFTHWAWIYWSMGIACACLTILAFLIIPQDTLDEGRNKEFDFLGAFTGVGGLVLFNVAWNQAPIVKWSTPYTYILLVIGVLLLSIFVYVELKVSQPLIPIKQMSPIVLRVLICVACGFGTFGILIYFYFNFLLSLRGDSPILAAVKFTPAIVSGLLAAAFTGFMLSKGVTTQVLMVIGLLAFVISAAMLSVVDVHDSYWASCFITFIIAPFGVDVCFPAATLLLSDVVPHEWQGISASLVATVVNYSISLALGVAGTAVLKQAPGTDFNAEVKATKTAAYVGCALSAVGSLVAIYGVIVDHFKRNRKS